jgi:hypothetical protein
MLELTERYAKAWSVKALPTAYRNKQKYHMARKEPRYDEHLQVRAILRAGRATRVRIFDLRYLIATYGENWNYHYEFKSWHQKTCRECQQPFLRRGDK